MLETNHSAHTVLVAGFFPLAAVGFLSDAPGGTPSMSERRVYIVLLPFF